MKRNYGCFFLRLFLALSCAAVFSLACSCDILRAHPFAVEAWSPGPGFHPDIKSSELSFIFSHDPDKSSVEKAFSLNEDGKKLLGYFSWEGRKMLYRLPVSFEKNREYRIRIDTEARDEKGLSLDEVFEAVFFTRPQGERPGLVSIFPADGGIMPEGRLPLRFEFSAPVDALSCVQHISLNPPADGYWETAGNNAIFSPAVPWQRLKLYTIIIASDFTDANGIAAGKEYISRFSVGRENTSPFLNAAYALDHNGRRLFDLEAAHDAAGNSPRENPGWERDYRLGLEFSKPVSGLSLARRLSILPKGKLVMENEPGFHEKFIFRFEDEPGFQSRFSIKLGHGVEDAEGNSCEEEYDFKVFADGALSKPPVLVGVRLPLVSASPADTELKAFRIEDSFSDFPIRDGNGGYTFDRELPFWIELYFDTADGASVDLFSLMELFSLEVTNNAMVFTPRRIIGEGFTLASPYAPWGEYQRIEVQGGLINRPSSGVVTVTVGARLLDTFGNRNEKQGEILLLK